MITAGDKAPDFRLADQKGVEHSLSDYIGRWVLVYFYPKDDTSGCTKEACGIRDNFPAFEKLNVVVLGISADTVQSHAKFADKYNLPFTLLSDQKKEVIQNYGAWGKKKMMGREYRGILRTSFLITPEGTVAKVYERVEPDKHADEVLADIYTYDIQAKKT